MEIYIWQSKGPYNKYAHSILKPFECERIYGVPCVVLVINDNLHVLMVTLSYICRNFPLTMLEPYVGFKVVRRR
jgi:hypothetical protein